MKCTKQGKTATNTFITVCQKNDSPISKWMS